MIIRFYLNTTKMIIKQNYLIFKGWLKDFKQLELKMLW